MRIKIRTAMAIDVIQSSSLISPYERPRQSNKQSPLSYLGFLFNSYYTNINNSTLPFPLMEPVEYPLLATRPPKLIYNQNLNSEEKRGGGFFRPTTRHISRWIFTISRINSIRQKLVNFSWK